MNNLKTSEKRVTTKRPVMPEKAKEVFRSAIGSVMVDGSGVYIYMNGKVVIVKPEGPLPLPFSSKESGVSVAVLHDIRLA